jgi:NAD(P)-dependent dehydrogenase (short-subunit alcohol dehydrogenase family)
MFNPFSLEGKTLLITGASSGIGQQCAIDCSKAGARVVLVARNVERLHETLAMMEGEDHQVMPFDLTQFDLIPQLVADMVSKVGPIHGILHCAGISKTEPLKNTKAETLNTYFSANVTAAVMLSKEVCKKSNYCKEGCSVVFFSSVMGLVGESCKSTYSITKSALLGAARSLAAEYAPKKVRFNCVSPGVVETPINRNQPYMSDPEIRKVYESKHLLGFGRTTDISNACIYLLADASRWVTGQNLVVDGGFTAM